jgi:hypothetical protein
MRLLLRATVVEEDDAITVRLGALDKHVAGCPACLAMFALRLSASLLHAIEDLKAGVEEADDERHILH